MDISLRTETAVAEDLSWLGSAHGFESTETGTADVSTFTEADHFPDGFLPSGLALVKSGSSDRWQPFSSLDPVDEVQTLTIDATGGTFTLTLDGETTAAIAEAATASAVQAALEALSNVTPGDVTVSGSAGGPYTLTFAGALAGQNIPTITTGAGSLTGGAGTAVIATSTAGAAGTGVDFGHLATSTKVNPASLTTDVGIAVMVHGVVREANLPTNHGVTSAFKTAVAGRLRYI